MGQAGLFWEPKVKAVKKRKGKKNVMPRIHSKWRPTKPNRWPNLKDEKIISLDVETYDPNLLTHGPGWSRGDGHLVGLSVAVSRNDSWYFPMRHSVESNLNQSPRKVLQWAKDNLTNPNALKIGANIIYDIGWLREEGVDVPGPYLDIQHVEALLNEHRRHYNLDSIAEQYLGSGKVSQKLYSWCAEYYGGAVNGSQRKNIHRAPVSYVGPYAEADAWQPYKIWKKQKKKIKEQKLNTVLDLEQRLIPLLIDMRFNGVKVDLDKAEQVRDQLIDQEKEIQQQLDSLAGVEVNVNAAATIQKAFDKNNLPYGYTAPSKTYPDGQPSFTKAFLEQHPSKIAQMIVEIRRVSKLRSTFIEGAILEKNVKGRIHCEFTQLKGESGGAITGRFSSRNPNLQNIPSRDPIYAPIIRGCFVPDSDATDWLRADLSQFEYRGLAHFAVGDDSDKIRNLYRTNPATDYHQATGDLIKEITGLHLDRKPTKGINFGICYGMGKAKLQSNLGVSAKKAKTLLDAYHEGVPFVKATFDMFVEQAKKHGHVKTILGRRARFPRWEEPWNEDKITYGTVEEAKREHGDNIQRAFTHKALNSVLQGSNADYIKKVMVDVYEAGIFDQLGGVPHLTVHDEIDLSCNVRKHKKIIREMKHIMEHCIPMRVPVIMDIEAGKNWGNCKEIDL